MRAVVPADARLGRDVRVDPDVTADDWLDLSAPSGTTIHRRSTPEEGLEVE